MVTRLSLPPISILCFPLSDKALSKIKQPTFQQFSSFSSLLVFSLTVLTADGESSTDKQKTKPPLLICMLRHAYCPETPILHYNTF